MSKSFFVIKIKMATIDKIIDDKIKMELFPTRTYKINNNTAGIKDQKNSLKNIKTSTLNLSLKSLTIFLKDVSVIANLAITKTIKPIQKYMGSNSEDKMFFINSKAKIVFINSGLYLLIKK